ncbi:MAG: aminotransferase class I/II-fold pyridoxal phosphate-dependent enzyme [Cyclobacteriaceae bacterium]|nr:aminotransferase class I/II-fold pyridoxal phosphate-dependent enzyme [Cyclobacteriaceae bacterium]
MIETAKRIEQIEEYYFSKKLAEVRSLDTPERKVINLGIGSPDLPPAQPVIDALATSAQQPAHHGYQSYKGIPELRKAIADFYNRTYDVILNPETMILPLMGSKEGILHISMAFLNEEDEALIPDPGYPTYASVTKLVGATPRTYTLKEELDWGIDLEALAQQDLSRVKIMWINFPHMPTGRTASRDELQALVNLSRKHNFLIVNDNPYSLILNDNPVSILSLDGAGDVALELNSLSKSHNMAGWRLGWVAGRKEYIDAVLRVRSNMDSGMFLGLQHAAVEALKNDASWFAELNRVYSSRKALACKILDALACTYSTNQSGLFVWAKVSERIKDVGNWIDEILYGAKVFITPGFVFGSAGERYIRISLCSSEKQLTEALARITTWKQETPAPTKTKQVVL